MINMNYFLLISAAVYCFFSGSHAFTAADLDAVCTKAATIQPHPYRCDAFLSCVQTQNVFKAFETRCPPKLMFDEKSSVCNWANQVTCDQACTDGDKFKAFYTCDTYFECTNNKFNPEEKKCAAGESFDATTKTCVTDASCGGSGECSTIEIPFSSDTSDTYKSYVHNVNVQVSDGYGVFDGTGYLTLPITNNNDYGDNFEIKFTFNVGSSQLGNIVALFGNFRCDDKGTLKVFLRILSNPAKFNIIIKYRDGSPSKRDKITQLNINTDYTLKITRQGPAFKVYLDGVETISATRPGKLLTNKCSYGIGNTIDKSNFVGKIKDFHFSKCLIEEKIVLG